MSHKPNVVLNNRFAQPCTQKSKALLQYIRNISPFAIQSVIKLPTKTDLKNSLPSNAKTKDVVLEEVS